MERAYKECEAVCGTRIRSKRACSKNSKQEDVRANDYCTLSQIAEATVVTCPDLRTKECSG